ncbi:hypothetical protein RHAB21_03500 [Pseudorhizobium halotolerans]|uniref:DUF2171 domain-containing protein n=1 Tax=Pseudorhizobium halotolerans TaxID=1233081 RepID=A0ABM8PRU3_9HYPH|nr:hypothetical protein RHAB21_03500 [Pseudorhizobium halotolerans]
MLGMDELVLGIEGGAQLRAPTHQFAGRVIGHVPEILLRFDDGVEIATIGDVDDDLAQPLDLCRQPLRMEEAGDIGEAHLLYETPFLAIGDVHLPRRRIDR